LLFFIIQTTFFKNPLSLVLPRFLGIYKSCFYRNVYGSAVAKAGFGFRPEEKRNAPNSAKAHKNIYKAAENVGGAKYPRNKVETENSYKAPVERSDYNQRKSKFVYD